MTVPAIPASKGVSTVEKSSTVRRLKALKANEKRDEQGRMAILDQLSVPKNVDDLERQVNDWRDCRMFFPMEGQPRAYMQFPIYGPDGLFYERWVYAVIGATMLGTRAKCEKILCEHMWQIFVRLRQQYAEEHEDNDPVIVYRRHFELTEDKGHKGSSPCFEHGRVRCSSCSQTVTRLTVRVHIPGVDIASVGSPDGMGLPVLTRQAV